MKTKKKLATLVLDPKRWLRGPMPNKAPGHDGGSFLLRPGDELMCCLGFECLRRGVKAKSMLATAIPSDLARIPGGKSAFTVEVNGYGDTLEREIATINDTDEIPRSRKGDLARVRKLRPLFEKLGVRLVLGRAK